jgi:threonine dehydrogenase-like Zn-dependent dehydrogenase
VPERRAFATSLGIDVAEPDVDALRARAGGHGFEAAIECSGSPDARVLALATARPWGRVAFVGEGNDVTFAVSPLVIHPQLTIVGSWVCSIGQMEELVELLVRWRLHPEVMVSDRFALEDAAEAYRLADSGRAGKVAITW